MKNQFETTHISQEQTCAQFTQIWHHAVAESSCPFPVQWQDPAEFIAMLLVSMQRASKNRNANSNWAMQPQTHAVSINPIGESSGQAKDLHPAQQGGKCPEIIHGPSAECVIPQTFLE